MSVVAFEEISQALAEQLKNDNQLGGDPEYRAAMERCRDLRIIIRPLMTALEQGTATPGDVERVNALNEEFGVAMKRAGKVLARIEAYRIRRARI